jgi:hypothetical protein
MDDLSNINEEISSISRQIEQEEGDIEAVERLAQNAYLKSVYRINAQIKLQWSTSRKKILLFQQRLERLQLIRDEPDWIVVFAQEQNGHDGSN